MSPFCCCFGKPKRTHSNASTIGSSTFATTNLTKIFDELKCPICFNVCVPPIHSCANGHIVCNNCLRKGSVKTCPTCREALIGARNFFAENFVINYAQQCKYASQGCEHLRLKGCNMKPHEANCMFRPLRCIVRSCGHEIPYKNLLGHLDFVHKITGTDTIPTTFQFSYDPKSARKQRSRWLPYYIQAFENVFFVMMQRVKKNYWIWTYVQAAKESDDLECSYNAYIKIKHPEKKISQSWYGPVYHIRTPFKTIMSEGCCFMIPEVAIKNYVSRKVLNFAVDIHKATRRTLKGLKMSGKESQTAVASFLPSEYTSPPSFYEPTPEGPANCPPPPEDNANVLEPPSEGSKLEPVDSLDKLPDEKPMPPFPPKRTRTAAIGIFRNESRSRATSRQVTPVVSVDEFNFPKSMHVDDEETSEQDYPDKIPSRTNTILVNMSKSQADL
ncbi:E3 ubiquitin-protein ligase Siah1 [Orchesella cincta]|uniref:RING-type E3 ubiquitin transferase n=1 Tax=Orchesella cincta TaxID=48709 RepID=A0A1D2N974_ORCCI|nr:E3 ubiquitin-protein ligase Siah1 [Orchesella cincta]